MMLANRIYQRNNKVFTVSPAVIWSSSLFMGVLASVPKILLLNIRFIELAVDASIAFLFSLFIWYYNIYRLPKFTTGNITTHFFNRRLLWSLSMGAGLIALLVLFHQSLFPHYNFRSMILMYEFRGVLINLTIYLFLYLLYQSYHVQAINTELERSKAATLNAQYELLKQQVNPHFLFNSLNTLKSMIEIQDQHSADFVVKLSDFYRFTLENRRMDIVPLEEELRILAAYMYLLKARFENGIHLETDLQPVHYQSSIPPFTLQLLIENCVKHNVISLEQPLHIRLYATGDHLIVENNLQLKDIPERSTRTGLENINNRYQHLLQQGISIEKSDTAFSIKLPLIYADTHH